MGKGTIEERLTAVEAELTELKRSVGKSHCAANGSKEVLWWEKHFGIFKDDPEFDAAMEAGAAYRRSQPLACDVADDDVPD